MTIGIVLVACRGGTGRRARRHDDIHSAGHQLRHERGQLIVAIVREAVVDADRHAVVVAMLAQPLEQALDEERPALGLE